MEYEFKEYFRNFIYDFVKASDFDYSDKITQRQLRALWTAYCMMFDYNVDTDAYYRNLGTIYYELGGENSNFGSYDEFEKYMSDDLI